MNRIDEIVGRAVRNLDPYGAGTLDEPGDHARAQSALDQILASLPNAATVTKPRVRPRWAVAVAVVSSAVVASLIITQAGPAGGPETTPLAAPPQPLVYAALSEPLSAQESLNQLADRVEALPDQAPSGPVLRITTRSFDLLTVVGENGVESTLEEQHSTRFIADGMVMVQGRGGPASNTLWGDITFSDNIDELRSQLQVGHPVENGVQSVIAAITDLYRETAPSSGVRAGILRILAEQGVRLDGIVTDRDGRRGVGYSIVHNGGALPTRVTLIFDSSTGWLLGQETVLIETAGSLNVPVPSVISYEIYADYDYVEAIEAT